MLAKWIISFAYFLESNEGYKRLKSFAHDILDNERSKLKTYFDFLMIFLVLITIAILIYDIQHEMLWYYQVIEDIAVSIFILEWLGRFWISADLRSIIIRYHSKMIELEQKPKLFKILKLLIRQKLSFVFSPMSIIDLLAILPTYRPLRILRVFLIFRLLKIFRYTKSLNSFFKVLIEKKSEFNILIMLSIFFIFMSSTILYVFEGTGNNPKIQSYLDAIYWAIITMSTVGYGDIVPVTMIGKTITVFLVSGGFIVIVFATSVVTNALSEKIEVLREDKVLSDISKFSSIIVIFGFGRMGEILAEELAKSHKRFIIVDKNDESIAKAKEHEYLYMQADASDYDTINNIIFKNSVKQVVLVTDNDALNISILLTIKAEKSDINVIVRANSYENIKKFNIAKADNIIFPYETVADVAVEYIGNSVKFDAINHILFQNSSITLDEIYILEGSQYEGKSIDESGILNHHITIIAIIKVSKNNKFIFNPDQEKYKFEVNDSLVVMGEEVSIEKIKNEIARQFR